MKHQSTVAKILLAILLFFQIEASQARTIQNCSDCALESCRDIENSEWCMKNCELAQGSSCSKATPEIRSMEDANRYGDMKRLRLLHEIYIEFPLSKYFLDLQAPEEPGREKSGVLSDEEKKQLKGALQKLEQGCRDIAQAVEHEGVKLPGGIKTFRQINDTLEKTQAQFTIINENLTKNGPRQEIPLDKIAVSNLTSASTRFEVKIVFDKSSLNVKNCFNQGETAIFTLKQQQEKCSKCTAETCKDANNQEWCINNCDLNKISKCLNVPLNVKNKDMYKYSGAKRIALFDKIYKKFPLSKYFLDFKSLEDLGAEKDHPITDGEKEQLKGAIKELEEVCQDIMTQLEFSKGEKISAWKQLNAFDQMKELMLNLKREFETFTRNLSQSVPPLTKLEAMRAFDSLNTNLKTFLSKGEEEVFKAKQKEGLMNKVITQFNCSLQCTAKKCKNLKSYSHCKDKCPAYQIESCLKAGAQAVAALNR